MAISPDRAREVLASAELVCCADAVALALERLAGEITAALGGSHPLVLCVMRGGLVFAGQLLVRLRFPLEVDYVDVTRYRNTTRGGEIAWKAPPGTPVAGRTVLVLDDILDEGHTLAAILEQLAADGANRVCSAVFVDKDTGRLRPCRPDFVGVTLPDRYLFGFGMDVGGAWRNLPEIYALNGRL